MKIKGHCGHHNTSLQPNGDAEEFFDIKGDILEVDIRRLFFCPGIKPDEEGTDAEDKCFDSHAFTISPEETPHPWDINPPPITFVETL